MNPIRSWFRAILPHEGIFLAALSLCLLPEAFYLAMGAPKDVLLSQGPISFTAALAEALHQTNVGFVFLATLALAAWRAWGFHPLFQPDYRRWLQSTPWTTDLPLPDGPVHLTLQDGALVLTATLLIWGLHPQVSPFNLVLAFLVAYEAVLASSMAILSLRRHTYSASFGLGLVVALWSQATMGWALLVAAMVYFELQGGLNFALSRMNEWNHLAYDKLSESTTRPEARPQSNRGTLGWPLEAFRPDRKFARIPFADGIVLCLLAGWWTNSLILAVQRVAGPAEALPAMLMTTFALSLAIFARLGIYLGGFAPPISLPGRIVTGRLILPGYDRVLLMPLTSFAILGIFHVMQRRYDLDPRLSAACMTTLALAPLLIGGPSLRDWQLTGEYRLSPMFSNSRNAGEIRVS